MLTQKIYDVFAASYAEFTNKVSFSIYEFLKQWKLF